MKFLKSNRNGKKEHSFDVILIFQQHCFSCNTCTLKSSHIYTSVTAVLNYTIYSYHNCATLDTYEKFKRDFVEKPV